MDSISGMNACLAVERDVKRIINKFGDIGGDFNKGLCDLISHIQDLKTDLDNSKSNKAYANYRWFLLKRSEIKDMLVSA